MLVILPIKISFVLILFVYSSRAATGAGPVVQRTSSSSLSRGRNSSFGGSDRIGDLPGTYPARRPAQRELVATKSKIWDRKEVEQRRTNNALRAHTAVLTTAGNAAIGVAKAGIQHLSNKFNVHATPEQKNYSKNVLHDAAHNLVTAPKQVYKESSDMLHNSKLKKGIAVHDYHKARKGENPYHQQPYTNQENNKIATNYHHEINSFYDKVHSRNQNLRNPGTAQGHAVGYPATAVGYPVNSVIAETGPSTTPAFLSSQKRIKDVHDHAIDRLDIERQRERHGSHLQVKTVTAAGNHLIKLSKTGVRHICTSLNCKATKTEKESAKRQWDMAKTEGFSAAKAIRNHANHVVKNSAAEQKNIYQDILKIQESKRKGEEIPHEIQNRYNEVNNHHAANALAEEKSANWSQVQQRSRMARRL